MFQPCYVVQRLDTGEFVGKEDGEKVYFVNFAKAHIFESLKEAIDYARDIDPYLVEVTVHGFFQPMNFQSIVL